MKKQVFLIFGIVLIAFAPLLLLTVAAVTFSLPRIYYANTRILVERGQSEAQPRGVRPDIPHPIFQMDQVEILGSRKIGYRVLEKEQLVTKWAISGPESAAKEQAFQVFRGRLNVQPARNSRIIEVGFYSTDPVESADLANATVAVYRDYVAGEPRDYRVTILDQARRPTAPCKPNVPVYLGTGLGAAVVLALAGVPLVLLGRGKLGTARPPPPPRTEPSRQSWADPY